MAQFPANVDLSSLNGATGFKLSGAAGGDNSGISVASAGDVNGDGFADLIVGARLADPHGGDSGASYVVFGKASGFAANIDLSSLDGTTGFKLSGAAANDQSGYSVASAGDVNGDGFADLIVGAWLADPHGTYSGASYVVFGKASGFAANVDLSSLDGATGFKLSGAAAFDRSGISVASAGDVNGDGFADLIVGAYGPDAHGNDSGASYVVFGKASGFAANIDLSSLDGSTGFKLSGAVAYDQSGRSVASAGDVNGDGFADLIVGALFADAHGNNSGASYVVFGKASGFAANIDLSSLDGSTGFKLSGAAVNDLSGVSVASAGDINGDGFADLIVGARFADPHGTNSGASYVVLGQASGFAANIDLSSLDGATGFKLSGAAAGDASGRSVASAGDVNGDGFADLIVAAYGADAHGIDSGASYVVFGQASGFAANIDLSALDGTTGFKLSGAAAGDISGRSVASAGDVNGDGFADLIVGAFTADPHGTSSGASYVVFGALPDTAVNRTGTGASQTLAGGNFNDTLSGLGGDDRLYGHGGSDTAVFSGARANYSIVSNSGPAGTTFTVTDLRAGSPDGTDTLTGIETLQFSDATVAATQFPANIDLSTLDGTTGFKLSGEAAADYSGRTVASAGDLNGDGFADVIVGAWKADAPGVNSGASYVVFGQASGFAANIDLSSLDGSIGFKLSGAAGGDQSGISVASAGDVNGDGFADLIVGAHAADSHGTNSGLSYVVFGKASGFAANVDLSALDGATGFRLSGVAAFDYSGGSVASAGDVNGDGFADLIVGASSADPHGSASGASYVVFGKASGFAANVDLSSLDGATGFRLSGAAAYDLSGVEVASAGDVNGDGFADVIVAAWGADPHGSASGASYVVFGKASGFAANIDLSSLDGATGFKLSGAAPGDLSGVSVASAGDVNGDGFADLIVGADRADPQGTSSGASYVVFGKASGFAANIDLSTLDGVTGFRLSGAAAYDFSGAWVASAGDVNGDGFADLIVGAFGADAHGIFPGASYVVFGKASGFAADIDLSTLDGATGFKLSGVAAYDYSGFSAASAGDVNGDGFADLIVGAFRADAPGVDSGASYVVFGALPDTAVNRTGTGASQTLAGGDFNDTLSGLGGDDRLYGHGGNDSLAGGAGNDTAVFSGARADYSIVETTGAAGTSFTVTDLRGGSPDGTDTLTGIENLQFSDTTEFPANIDLSTLDGATGFKLSGAAGGDNSGNSVASAGDVNGDGFADLIVGAFRADPHGNLSGTSYVVFGKASGFAANLDLSTLDGATGFKLSGAATFDNAGTSVASAGDVNGDGFADLIVGAPGADAHGIDSGASYVVFGKASGFAANIDLSALDGTTGFKLSGAAGGDNSGNSVAAAGDVNGDGFADLIVGAFRADPHGNLSGASYVVFGQASGFAANIDLSSLDGVTGFKLSGAAAYDYSGISVAAAGDVNGDGFGDLIVGAWTPDPHGIDSGASYVVFGKASGFAANLDLSTLDGATGFKLSGAATFDNAGTSVASAGDVNGDGFADLIVGAPGADAHGIDSGASYVMFGQASGFAANIDLSSLDGTTGFRLSGAAAGDISGRSVASAGDVNGDGFADLIVGARYADPNGTNSGASYVVFGALPDTAVNRTGTGASQTLAGGNFNDTLSGLGGDDRLYGNGGNDTVVFSGALANYIVSQSNGALTVSDLRGGSPDGTDTLIGIEHLQFSDTTVAATQFPANIDLSTLDGATGFKLSGAAAFDLSGVSVASAGDVNGDGFADLIVGAWFADPHGNSASGASYVVFGKASGFAAKIDVSSLDGATGFKLSGAGAGDLSGVSVASAGDVNGDGLVDLIVGASGADAHGNDSGASYVVFGKASGFAANIDLSSLDGSTGFKLTGAAAFDRSGISVASAGDVNGDGFADLIVGAYGADPHDSYSSGASYVVFGKPSGFAANVDLSTLDGATGFKLSGAAAGDGSGVSVASAGDVNGDGFADLIVGANGADPHGNSGSGASYVVFGKASGFAANIDLSSLDGSTGFKLSGAAAGDQSGRSVASAGDVNGDGFADLIVGAVFADPHGNVSGASYVVFGQASGFAADIDLSSLDGATGFKLSGAAAYDYSGISVASAGDVNGDGFDDLIVGAHGADAPGNNSGASYVVFGQASGFAANINLSALDGATGFKLSGAAYDYSGRSVGSAGDVNGDGFADVIVGATFADPNDNTNSGASYVVFGALPDTAVNRTGTGASQTLAGGNFNDTLSGLGGDDRLYGNGGNDRLDGGAGTDTTFGGQGDDTYVVDSLSDVVTEAASAGTDEVQTALASYSLAGLANVENLTGTAATGQTLTGNGGANVITGGAGNDTLDGGAGVDTMIGGTGNDVYVVDSLSDTVTEAANAGTDEVQTALASYSLAGRPDVENLTGTAATGQTLTGNGGANTITGGAGNDTLDGGAGNDTMLGGQGNDSYRVDSANDVVTETAGGGYDIVVATADYVMPANVEALYLKGTGLTGTGSTGDDILLSAASGGANTLIGLVGNDLYYVSHTGDTVTEIAGGGSDTVVATADYTLPANVEALYLVGTGLTGTGSAGADTLLSAASGGANTLVGLGGNDFYFVNHTADAVTDAANGGSDTVVATVDYTLPTNVEALYLVGTGLTGTGSAGADTLLSAGGANTLIGLDGDDLYYVNYSGDTVTEAANGGSDTVVATADYTLPANVEALYLIGTGLTGTGSAGADTLLSVAGGGANTLVGLGGDDLYYVNHTADAVTEAANGGYDTVVATVDYTMPANVEALYLVGTGLTGTGSAGADTLVTVGANTLAGAGGNDTFVFLSDHANGATVADFDGQGAGQGDTLIFSGFGTAAQNATFTSLGHDQWQIHSGLDAHNETITLGNGASIHATDFFFV